MRSTMRAARRIYRISVADLIARHRLTSAVASTMRLPDSAALNTACAFAE